MMISTSHSQPFVFFCRKLASAFRCGTFGIVPIAFCNSLIIVCNTVVEIRGANCFVPVAAMQLESCRYE